MITSKRSLCRERATEAKLLWGLLLYLINKNLSLLATKDAWKYATLQGLRHVMEL